MNKQQLRFLAAVPLLSLSSLAFASEPIALSEELSSLGSASEPIALSEQQMDQVYAGAVLTGIPVAYTRIRSVVLRFTPSDPVAPSDPCRVFYLVRPAQ
jgi:hypothetical protein